MNQTTHSHWRLIALLLMLITAANSWAYDFEVDGIYYDKNGNKATVTYNSTNYNSYSGNVIIPSTVTYDGTTYRVSSIGNKAFADCDGLTSVTIPNTVLSIGVNAFYRCTGLTSVTIPNSLLSISVAAFADCDGLISVTIGYSVSSIGFQAFAGCNGLTSINVDERNLNYCSIEGVLFSKDATTILAYPNAKGEVYTIPNTVTSIGSGAFAYCTGLTSVTIPDSVTSIGSYAFDGCTGLISVTIPNSVTSIGGYSFSGCTGLTSVTIGNSVTSIGQYAFTGCEGLISVTIPNSVTSIGGYAFSCCSGLTSVTIGNSVTSIGSGAFSGCTGLTLVTNLALKPQSIYSSVFESVDLDACVLYVPEESLDTYKEAYGWKEFGEILPIETSTSAIDGISAYVDAAAEYYNLQGVLVVGEPTPGIYIKRVGTQTEKVLVK